MFDAEKILQEIGYLLLRNDNRINLFKLVKELYLIDRLSLDERDSSVSGDSYLSLSHGPVLSSTLNILYDFPLNEDNPWRAYLRSEESEYYPDIVLFKETPEDSLSEKDRGYIEAISDEFRNFGNKEIEDYTRRNLPEWKYPRGRIEKIRFYDIMAALGRTHEEILESKREYECIKNLNDVLNNRQLFEIKKKYFSGRTHTTEEIIRDIKAGQK
jgi:hypothetical protein